MKRVPLPPASYSRSLWVIGRFVLLLTWDRLGHWVTQKDSGHVFKHWIFIGTVFAEGAKCLAVTIGPANMNLGIIPKP